MHVLLRIPRPSEGRRSRGLVPCAAGGACRPRTATAARPRAGGGQLLLHSPPDRPRLRAVRARRPASARPPGTTCARECGPGSSLPRSAPIPRPGAHVSTGARSPRRARRPRIPWGEFTRSGFLEEAVVIRVRFLRGRSGGSRCWRGSVWHRVVRRLSKLFFSQCRRYGAEISIGSMGNEIILE